MINLKTAAKVAFYGCTITAIFSLGMSIWSIIDGNKIGLGISLVCLGVMTGCALINHQNYNRLD